MKPPNNSSDASEEPNVSFLGGIIHAVTNVTKLIPGPVGMISGLANRATSAPAPTSRALTVAAPVFSTSLVNPMISAPQGQQRPEPGARGMVHRAVPGGYSGYLPRRHMNFANVKAARRAGRRIEGAIRLLRGLEKQLPHKIVHVKGKRAR